MKVVLHKDRFISNRSVPASFMTLQSSDIADADFLAAPSTDFHGVVKNSINVPVDRSGPFRAGVSLDDRLLQFSIAGMRDIDELHVEFTDSKRFTARVVHKGAKPPHCRAICPDGTEGHPCVTCHDGDATFIICC